MSSCQMVEMHEMVLGKCFNGCHELGQYTFAKNFGLYIIVPQQFIVEVCHGVVYMIIGGKSLKKFHEKLTYFIMILVSFTTVVMALSHLGNVAFTYAGYIVVLEIQARIQSTPKKPSKIRNNISILPFADAVSDDAGMERQ
ncbi:hypothetical protein PTKIN_Ptkin13bG0038300 [Pterospermum kingtungense]